MKKQKIWGIVSVVMAVLCTINLIYLYSESYYIKNASNVLYDVDYLSVEDVEINSTFRSCTSVEDDDTGEIEVRYKKLYGIEHIADYELDKDSGIEVISVNGDPVKILIFDEGGKQRFYKEISQLNFEPGEIGEYSVYIVAKGFTGEIVCSTY